MLHMFEQNNGKELKELKKPIITAMTENFMLGVIP